MPTKLTNEIIIAAITGFESQKTRIDLQIAELQAMLDGGTKPTPAATPETPKRKRRLSRAGRAAIVAALKKRWAAKKAATARPKPVAARKAGVKKAAVKTAQIGRAHV